MRIIREFKKMVLNILHERCIWKLNKLNTQFYNYNKKIQEKLEEGSINEVKLKKMQLKRRRIHKMKMDTMYEELAIMKKLNGLN